MAGKTDLSITDMFCGCGGASLGAQNAGGSLVLGMNHWARAIETHSTNFPEADHALCDVSLSNPRWYPRTTVLLAAPECTNHSVAKGIRRKHGQKTMFEPVVDDPAAERSRATAWDVVRFTEHHRYEIVIVENVTDFRKWELFDAWWQAMLLLGYAGQVVYLNSMFCHPTPQSRDRMYVCFWKQGNRRPNLDIRPAAWCRCCEKHVEAVQSWKQRGKQAGRYRQQYVYRCPICANVVEPYYYCAANAIDWSLPAPRIADRPRPLSERTLRRIQVGLERFGRHRQPVEAVPPFLVSLNHTTDRVRPVTDPSATVMPQAQPSLCVPPFVAVMRGTGEQQNEVDRIDEALSTVCGGGHHHGMVVPPFLVSYYSGGGQTSGVGEPLPTQDTRDRHSLVLPPDAFIMSYYKRKNDRAASSVGAPLPTQPSWALHHLVVPNESEARGLPEVEDCGFRMLQPHEIAAAMAFPDPDRYPVMGTQRERIKQYGNAVTPPVMSELFRRCVATLA